MIQNGFCETVAEVSDAEAEGQDEIHPKHVPPEVEPENHDFDVNEFLRTSPNPVVASVFGKTPRHSEQQQYAVDILS